LHNALFLLYYSKYKSFFFGKQETGCSEKPASLLRFHNIQVFHAFGYLHLMIIMLFNVDIVLYQNISVCSRGELQQSNRYENLS